MNERGAIRLIDAGSVPALRSQALYHGLAYARTDETPDTIVLATPATPYVCVGFHQDIAHEVDVAYCRRARLPVLRRETGGGTVYIDADQFFVQWVMGTSALPARVEARFELFCATLVDTYRDLGIAAAFRPLNDVHVEGRKIAGTGAAHIGQAEVVTGNFIFDFDTSACARVLRAPSEAFRDQVERSLRTYMTSMRAELRRPPDRARVADRYAEQCEATLRRPLEPGKLTADEVAAIRQAERRLASSEFQDRPGGLRRGGVKIHQDVHVVESERESHGAHIRVTARLHHDRIEDLSVRVNDQSADGLADALRGVRLSPEPVMRAVFGYELRQAQRFSIPAEALAQAILDLPHTPKEPDHVRRP